MIKPLGNRILILPVDQNKEEVTKTGIILVKKEEDIKPSTKGQIIAVGAKVPEEIEIGATVLYSQNSGIPITWDEKEYLVMRDTDLICVV